MLPLYECSIFSGVHQRSRSFKWKHERIGYIFDSINKHNNEYPGDRLRTYDAITMNKNRYYHARMWLVLLLSIFSSLFFRNVVRGSRKGDWRPIEDPSISGRRVSFFLSSIDVSLAEDDASNSNTFVHMPDLNKGRQNLQGTTHAQLTLHSLSPQMQECFVSLQDFDKGEDGFLGQQGLNHL